MGMRRMKVDKLGIDLLTHDPVVILKDMEGKRHLPILIGPFEATAIALALEGTQVPRPLSHDLMKSVIEALKAKVNKIVIHDIQENTFFAKVVLESSLGPLEIDQRPEHGCQSLEQFDRRRLKPETRGPFERQRANLPLAVAERQRHDAACARHLRQLSV